MQTSYGDLESPIEITTKSIDAIMNFITELKISSEIIQEIRKLLENPRNNYAHILEVESMYNQAITMQGDFLVNYTKAVALHDNDAKKECLETINLLANLFKKIAINQQNTPLFEKELESLATLNDSLKTLFGNTNRLAADYT